MPQLDIPIEPGDELAFRSHFDLCIRCGRGRREVDSDLCGDCEYRDSNLRQQIQSSNDYWTRKSVQPERKKKYKKSGSAA